MKKKLVAWILTILMVLMLVPMSNVKAAGADEIVTLHLSLDYGQSEARTIFNMINQMRTSSTDAWYWNLDNTTKITCNNLKELQYDYDLEKIAMVRAKEIALSYDHTRPNGQSCFTAYDISCSDMGENIAAGQTSAVSVNKAWREDDKSYSGQGHRRNMLSGNFNCVGIGHVYYNGFHYWVEEFANRSSVNTNATVADDNKQTVSVEVLKSNIESLDVPLNQTDYNIKTGDSVLVEISANSNTIAKVKDNWPSGKAPIIDTLQIGVADSAIASYSNNKLTGIREGNTNLTAKLGDSIFDLSNKVNVLDKDDVSICSITLSKDTYTYSGEAIKPDVVVKKDSTVLKENTDYVITYVNNINAGTAYVEIEGINDWSGSIRKEFTINPKDIENTSVILGATCDKETQEGITPSFTIKDGDKVLVEDIDYTVTFKSNDNGGYIYYRGLGNYSSGATTHIMRYGYHQYVAKIVIKYSTCSEHGIRRCICYNCHKLMYDEELELDPDSHTYDKGVITKEPTCTEEGVKTYTCTGCGKTKL